MKESQFIKQNKEKWLESERVLKSPEKDSDKVSSLFTQLVDDLSYARTFFSHRFITVYLNQTSMKIFSLIYQRKKNRWAGFVSFWKEELPQVVIHCRKELLLSVVLLFLSMAIGVISSAKDPEFVSSILGSGYVEMTKENIKSGDPMAVYKKMNQYDMFLQITINNIRVAFITYIAGLLAGIGTLFELLYNGIMLGAFLYFFYERHLLGQSMLAIWLHGTLEISSIVIAGGAGFTLIRGFIMPGTLPRMQSFYTSAARSLKLVLGTVPIFIMAGFVESFVTRYTEVPAFIRLIFILISLAFIIGYFVVYPYLKSTTGFEKPLAEAKLTPTDKRRISFNTIKNNADIFQDTFVLYLNKFARLSTAIFATSVILNLALHYLRKDTYSTYEDAGNWWFFIWVWWAIKNLFELFRYPGSTYMLICSLVTGLLLFFVNHVVYQLSNAAEAKGIKYYSLAFINSFCTALLIHFTIYSTGTGGILFLVLLLPYLLLLNYTAIHHKRFLLLALGIFLNLVRNSFLKISGMFLMLILVTITFTLILDSPMIYLTIDLIKMSFPPDLLYLKKAMNFISSCISTFVLLSVLSFNFICIALQYYSGNEILTATGLSEKIRQMSEPKTRYGT